MRVCMCVYVGVYVCFSEFMSVCEYLCVCL